MGREWQVRVKSPVKNIDIVIDNNMKGRQLFAKVMSLFEINHGEFFKIQYKNKKGQYADIHMDKKVVSDKKMKMQIPMEMFLTIAVFPPDPSGIEDFTAKFLLFHETEIMLKTGDLECPHYLTDTLAALLRKGSIDEYLGLVGSLEDYGLFHFHVQRSDGLPCRLSISLSGITNASGNERHQIPFEDIRKINGEKKVLKVSFLERGSQPLIFYTKKKEDCERMLKVYSSHVTVSRLLSQDGRPNEYV